MSHQVWYSATECHIISWREPTLSKDVQSNKQRTSERKLRINKDFLFKMPCSSYDEFRKWALQVTINGIKRMKRYLVCNLTCHIPWPFFMLGLMWCEYALRISNQSVLWEFFFLSCHKIKWTQFHACIFTASPTRWTEHVLRMPILLSERQGVFALVGHFVAISELWRLAVLLTALTCTFLSNAWPARDCLGIGKSGVQKQHDKIRFFVWVWVQ